jgi:glycosyltransferase involved in cell wall biosynthesis
MRQVTQASVRRDCKSDPAHGTAASKEEARAGTHPTSGALRPVALVLGPEREAVSGVSTHVSLLCSSRLAEDYRLVHFRVGSEGRDESALGRLARLVASPFTLALAILGRGASIVHINTSLNVRAYWRDVAYLIVAKLCGARVLYQMHGGALPREFCRRSRLFEAFLRWTFELADAVVVLAQSELAAYQSFVPRQQVLVVPNCIDSSPYPVIPCLRSRSGGALRIAYFGRLAREKGIYELLQGLKVARAEGVGARLMIAGSGPEEAQLRRTVTELGLTSDVSFVGPVFGNEKVKLLAGADVLALPSYSEGLPYALLEAMAAGAPVIVTPVGAIPDVVVEGVHGLFVPPRDAAAIARAIAKLTSDRSLVLRMSAACRRRVAGSYTLERFSTEFGRVYSGLCPSKHANALTKS